MESLFFLKVPGPPRWSDLIFHSRTLTEPRAFILTELHRNSHNLLKSLATMASEGREGFWQRAYHRTQAGCATRLDPCHTHAQHCCGRVRHQKLSRLRCAHPSSASQCERRRQAEPGQHDSSAQATMLLDHRARAEGTAARPQGGFRSARQAGNVLTLTTSEHRTSQPGICPYTQRARNRSRSTG